MSRNQAEELVAAIRRAMIPDDGLPPGVGGDIIRALQRTEATQTLGTFLREDILHIAHITGQDIPAVFDTGRE